MLPAAALALILTIALAELSYRIVERPALRLKERLSAGADTRREATPGLRAAA